MIACLLLAANCNVHQEMQYRQSRYTAVHTACHQSKRGELVCLLIEHGARVMPTVSSRCFHYPLKIRFGRTAIHQAVKDHKMDLVYILLDHNANVSLQEQSGWTALMEGFITFSKIDKIQLLICCWNRWIWVDKKFNLQDVDGFSALHFAAIRDS